MTGPQEVLTVERVSCLLREVLDHCCEKLPIVAARPDRDTDAARATLRAADTAMTSPGPPSCFIILVFVF